MRGGLGTILLQAFMAYLKVLQETCLKLLEENMHLIWKQLIQTGMCQGPTEY